MSDAPEIAPEVREQFMTRPTAETLSDLESQRLALGFLTSNALALVVLHEFAKVPEGKFWEALAKVRAYHPRKGKANTKGGKRS